MDFNRQTTFNFIRGTNKRENNIREKNLQTQENRGVLLGVLFHVLLEIRCI